MQEFERRSHGAQERRAIDVRPREAIRHGQFVDLVLPSGDEGGVGLLVERAVALVLVGSAHAGAELRDSMRTPLPIGIVLRGSGVVPRREFRAKPGGDRVVELEGAEDRDDLGVEHALRVVRSAAVLTAAGVVHELVRRFRRLLQLPIAREHPATLGAAHDAGERKEKLSRLRLAPDRERALRALEERARDDRLVFPLVRDPAPRERAAVERVREHLHDVALPDASTGARAEAEIECEPGEIAIALLAPRRLFEQTRHERACHRVRLNAVGRGTVAVAERGLRWPCALAPALLMEPLLHFLAQVLDVVSGHAHLNALQEALAGVAVGTEGRAFFDEHDVNAGLVDGDKVAPVSQEPIGLLDEHGLHLLVLTEILHHRDESGAARGFRGLLIAELRDDANVRRRRMREQEPALRRDGVAFDGLLST